jgi:valyl-tRNA synthetase
MSLETRYNPSKIEGKIYKFWLEKNYFSAKVSSNQKPFTIVIPPPNITGILHMGHALNNTIQDVLIRFKRMQGYQALWMPGTDHAGIATQNVVERELAKKGEKKEDVGREEFLKLLWEWRDKYGSTIIEQLKKLGASCDWARTRFTMDQDYSQAVREVFVRLYQKGLIYQGNYIINWCPRCKTALSDEESPHREIEGWLYYIRYPVKKVSGLRSQVPKYIVVATTRPETMLGDTAVAINPSDKRYKWLKKGVKVILPVMERELLVVEDDVVDPKFGTGVVKVTPAHDPADFILAKKYNLEFINIMNDDATLNHNAGDFAGMDRFEARQALLELLEEKELIEKKEPYKISAGHCYRCHTIIEPRLSQQWFVKMRPLAQPAIKVVEEGKIRFYPERWKKVYLNWMYNIQDWCISRQIWWGHRLPVWYCKECQKDTDNQLTETRKGTIVSRDKPQVCPWCGSTQLEQDQDVLDTWFSSWLWPFATFYWPFEGQKTEVRREKTEEFNYFYPTDVLVTASEILFFWVARMIMAGLEFTGKIPFREVLIHGTVRDQKGVKMSKSLGNIIDPLEIIDKFGADSLRFSLMLLASGGADVYLSSDKFLVGRNFSNKIWNATRFILTKIKEDNIEVRDLDLNELQMYDKWVLSNLNQTIEEITSFLEAYRINEAAKKIYEFFWHIFCDWYIEIAKLNFNLNTAKVLVYSLINSLKLLHPLMPFITEEVYGLLKKVTYLNLDESIARASWPKKLELSLDDEPRLMNRMIEIIKEVRNLRADLGIPLSKKIKIFIKTNQRYQSLFNSHKNWIQRLANLEGLEFRGELERVLFKMPDLELDLSLEEVDRERFILSLEKRIRDLDSRLSKVSSKLRNERFLRNAPRELVTQQKEKFNNLSTQIERLTSLKQRLKAR